jgi:hypothetical protein
MRLGPRSEQCIPSGWSRPSLYPLSASIHLKNPYKVVHIMNKKLCLVLGCKTLLYTGPSKRTHGMSRQGLKTIKFLDKITVGLVVAAGAAWVRWEGSPVCLPLLACMCAGALTHSVVLRLTQAAKHQWEADKPETSSVPKASK